MDGLGSVRTVAGSTNTVLETRTYDPYGQPLSSTGTPQTPFGFTGEQMDANGLLYLRARHYAPAIGAFTARDPYEGAASRPMSLNGYVWVEGNAVNAVDPSGRIAQPQLSPNLIADKGCHDSGRQKVVTAGSSCPPSGASRCEYLASEIACMVERYQQNLGDNPALYLLDENAIFVNLLAEYYSAIPFTAGGLWVGEFRPFARGDRELYPIPGEPTGADLWRNPINYASSANDALLQNYGFRRPYFGNTHHFFAYLKLSYLAGIPLAGTINYEREIRDLETSFADWQQNLGTLQEEEFARRYAWIYQEAVNDLYLTDRVFELRLMIETHGIGIIADFVRQEMCAPSTSDVWSQQSSVNEYYFDLPESYWPSDEFWPQ